MRCRAVHGKLPGYAPFLFLRCFASASLLDRQNYFWGSLAEPFGVELFDKLWQGQLPRLLLVVIDLAQLRGVHPQFARHVDLCVRQMVALSRLDPCLHLPSGILRLVGHTIIFLPDKPPISSASDLVGAAQGADSGRGRPATLEVDSLLAP